MPEHTPEPWKTSHFDSAIWFDGPKRTQMTNDLSLALDRRIAICQMPEFPKDVNDANMRRIVACVNFLAGIPTERLEDPNVRAAIIVGVPSGVEVSQSIMWKEFPTEGVTNAD